MGEVVTLENGNGKCPECGLPIVECNAQAIGCEAAQNYLIENGYQHPAAKEAAERLVPFNKPPA
jgi:hypothetical protein